MIIRIPALEFMQNLIGTYCSGDGLASLLVTGVGYGQIVDFRLRDKIQIAGVIGASGYSVELLAQLGLPNVVRFSGSLRSKGEISFEASGLPIGLVISREGDTLTLITSFNGAPPTNYVLQRA
ncbi:hypothetical protein VC218_11495 [Xanthomonas nasturtii]|uniref:hypothetical protein n=1 Tax=Xanthomonas nasturtii TaxID=1843581 RepID=UPI002B2372EA|nr:hypothetical protein [Xanthomonas nasturtii]MEA9579510.1 hypothetical protein [Xanthomonas nasturtii]